MGDNQDMLDVVRTREGFIAALDQSGGSTPTALSRYGIGEDAYSDEETMFAIVHDMRSRIVMSKSFGGNRIVGAILFEGTMDRQIEGMGSAEFLWKKKEVVPFLKIDKGLADEAGGVQLMKPNPTLGGLLEKAKAHGIFGTKMRSVIQSADADGIATLVDQQFETAREICAAGLVPIIEPEVNIETSDKRESEAILAPALLGQLDQLSEGQNVILKLSLPEEADLYHRHVAHPRVVRVVALSGGYPREEANRRLAMNHGMIASFSRALSEGLSAQQTDEEFDRTLDASIDAICRASRT